MLSLCLKEFIGLCPKCYSLLFNGEVKGNVVVCRGQSQKTSRKMDKKGVKIGYLHHAHYRSVVRDLNQV